MSEEYKILAKMLSIRICGGVRCNTCQEIFGEKYMCHGQYSLEQQVEFVKNIIGRLRQKDENLNVSAQDIADVLLY